MTPHAAQWPGGGGVGIRRPATFAAITWMPGGSRRSASRCEVGGPDGPVGSLSPER